MDLNPLFTGITSFRPHESGGALQLFEGAGINLVHGWVVDPDTPAHAAFRQSKAEDYDAAVGLLAEVDHLTGGNFYLDVNGPGSSSGSEDSRGTLSAAEKVKVENGASARLFPPCQYR
jgi:ubiquitin carboxyl-terminal hydrolase MINDY-1/2